MHDRAQSGQPGLGTATELFRLLVEQVVDYAIFLLTPDGHVASWNHGAERLKGYTPAEIIGESFERFYTEADRAAGRPQRLLNRARFEGRVEDEGWRVRKDGSLFWADVIITSLWDDSERLVGFAKVTRDLTERCQAEQDRAARMAAEQAAERFERLQVATAALAGASRPQSAADVLTEAAMHGLGNAETVVGVPTPDGTALELVSVRGTPFGAELGQRLPLQGSHPLARAWQQRASRFGSPLPHNGTPVPAGVDSRDVLLHSEADYPGTWAALPLVLDQRIVGVLGVVFDTARGLDTDERGFLLALAEVGAQALDRARLYAAEERARREAEAAERSARDEAQLVETLHTVSLALSAELDLDTVVQAVTDAATSATGAAFGAFLRNEVDERGERYTVYALSGAARATFSQFPTPRVTAVFEPTFRGQGVVRSDDIRSDPRYGKSAPHFGIPDGHLPVRSYLAVPVVSRSGQVLGGLFFGHERTGVFTDRAERLALGIAAQAAVAIDNARLFQEVQRALRTRDEFLAAAAHDLKTPLASTKGIAQLLRRRIERMHLPDSEPITNGLVRIDQSVDHMTGLIDELLDVGRLQMGQPLDLEHASVDLVDMLRKVLSDHEPNAPRHTLRVQAAEEPIIGNWDPIRLRRVLDNLVSNAIKYSPEGGEVSVRVERLVDAGPPIALISVTDHGVGIPATDLPFVFERFRRGGNVGFAHGTGIGLAIARSIVTQHGGSMSVESEEGKGSTFSVRLPLD